MNAFWLIMRTQRHCLLRQRKLLWQVAEAEEAEEAQQAEQTPGESSSSESDGEEEENLLESTRVLR